MNPDLPSATLAFRVMLVTGIVGLIGLLLSGWYQFFGVVLVAAGAFMMFEAWRDKAERLTVRRRRFTTGGAVAIGGLVLFSGLASIMVMPLLVIAAISGVLWIVGTLGNQDDQGDRYAD